MSNTNVQQKANVIAETVLTEVRQGITNNYDDENKLI